MDRSNPPRGDEDIDETHYISQDKNIRTEFKKLLEDCKFDHALATIVLFVFIALSNNNLFVFFVIF